MDWFAAASVTIDGECLSQDFDSIDLYGNRKVEYNTEDVDIQFE